MKHCFVHHHNLQKGVAVFLGAVHKLVICVYFKHWSPTKHMTARWLKLRQIDAKAISSYETFTVADFDTERSTNVFLAFTTDSAFMDIDSEI